MGIKYNYNTTALRLAAVFDLNDIGEIVRDLQNGNLYLVQAAGSGATSFTPLTSLREATLQIPLSALRIVTSGNAVGNIAAIGGVGASDSDPILQAASSHAMELKWATGSVVAVGAQLAIPADADLTRNMSVDLEVYSGATDKASFTVATAFDAAAETSYSADDAATKSATKHTITATILLADIPAAAKNVSIRLTPSTAHSTNAYQLCGARLRYFRV